MSPQLALQSYFKECCLLNSQRSFQWNEIPMSKARKTDNFESHNSLKLSFVSVRDLCSNFFGCKSFLESNSPDILSLYETNLDWFWHIHMPWSWSWSCYSYAWSCSLCKGGPSFCTGFILKQPQNSYLCFWLVLLHSVSYFLFLYRSPCLSLWTVFDALSSNIDERASNMLMCLSLETLKSIISTG